MSKPTPDPYDPIVEYDPSIIPDDPPITPGDDEFLPTGKHEFMPSYQDGKWESRPDPTLWQLGVVLTSDEEKENPPPRLRDAYHAVRDHPTVAGIMHYALELFPNHVCFTTATVVRIKLWLQVKHGFRMSDVGQVTLVEVERLLRGAIDVATDAAKGEVSTVSQPGAEEPPAGRPLGTVNQRMLEEIEKNPECIHWSQRYWATYLDCGTTAVNDAPAWQRILQLRANAKAVRIANDRSRKSERSPRRR
jgi:hypothetical protein